jgi:hypothetical protein
MPFQDANEFKRCFEQIFQLMNDHPEVGRPLRDLDAPNRFEITDFDLVFNVAAAPLDAEADGRLLRWTWGDEGRDWEPLVSMKMSSEVANRFFQGKENVALAVALGRVKLRGPLSKILEMAPITKPIHGVYRTWLAEQGFDHLLA